MTITDKDELIINIDGRTKLISREQIIKAFAEPKANCANYERDNVETDLNPYSPTAKWINSENVVFKGHRDAEKWKPNKKDLIVEAVREDLLKRSQVGIKKYGTTNLNDLEDIKNKIKDNRKAGRTDGRTAGAGEQRFCGDYFEKRCSLGERTIKRRAGVDRARHSSSSL